MWGYGFARIDGIKVKLPRGIGNCFRNKEDAIVAKRRDSISTQLKRRRVTLKGKYSRVRKGLLERNRNLCISAADVQNDVDSFRTQEATDFANKSRDFARVS